MHQVTYTRYPLHVTHAHTHAGTRTHVHTHTRTHTNTPTHTHAHTHTHTPTYTYTHTYACTHMHTPTHTHTHTGWRSGYFGQQPNTHQRCCGCWQRGAGGCRPPPCACVCVQTHELNVPSIGQIIFSQACLRSTTVKATRLCFGGGEDEI